MPLGRAQAFHHADSDREKRQIGRNNRLGQQPGYAHGIEHHHNHRRNRQNGNGLAGNHPRHDRAIHHPAIDNPNRNADAQSRANGKAQQRGRQRYPTMINKAALGGDLLFRRGFPDFGHHLMRGGQNRAVLRHRIGDQFGE